MQYTLLINDLDIICFIGIYPHELTSPQQIRINVECVYEAFIDFNNPNKNQVVCYEEMVHGILRICKDHIFFLEGLGESIAALCFQDERVKCVRMRVEKLEAISDVKSVGLMIERVRP